MGKVLMKGNEAIGEAAIRAGCLNYFAYPITPQSEVAEYLSKRLPEAGGVFVQGESEVAVSYMIFGASACGARVFTTSSSPGISLMSEGISYIAAAQCPAVFINIMRGGPGLGGILPSQADYFQSVKGGGHGDYRLLVMAPASVQEAVEMTMTAFPLAEKYRNPVMILGDGLIGQMMEPVEFPDQLKSEPSNKDGWATSGMDTRRSATRNLVKTLYLVPEELNAHNLKLKAKYDRMIREEIRWDLQPGCGLPRAHRELRHHEPRVPHGHRQLQGPGHRHRHGAAQDPLSVPEQAVYDAAARASCRAAISVEMSMGQMVEDVELSVKGLKPVHWYGKCGGEVPTPEEVMEEIRS